MSKEIVEGILAHHGIKGMKWGVRRKASELRTARTAKKAEKLAPKEVKVQTKLKGGQTKIKTSGGKNQPAHVDAIDTRSTQQKLRKSGVDTLSNQQLQQLQTRLTLEKNVSRLDADHQAAGEHFVVRFLKDPAGRRKIKDVADTPQAKAVGKAVGNAVKKKAVAGLATAAIVA